MGPILTGQWLDTFPKCIVLLRDMHWRRTCWEDLARSPGCRREAVECVQSVEKQCQVRVCYSMSALRDLLTVPWPCFGIHDLGHMRAQRSYRKI